MDNQTALSKIEEVKNQVIARVQAGEDRCNALDWAQGELRSIRQWATDVYVSLEEQDARRPVRLASRHTAIVGWV